MQNFIQRFRWMIEFNSVDHDYKKHHRLLIGRTLICFPGGKRQRIFANPRKSRIDFTTQRNMLVQALTPSIGRGIVHLYAM